MIERQFARIRKYKFQIVIRPYRADLAINGHTRPYFMIEWWLR